MNLLRQNLRKWLLDCSDKLWELKQFSFKYVDHDNNVILILLLHVISYHSFEIFDSLKLKNGNMVSRHCKSIRFNRIGLYVYQIDFYHIFSTQILRTEAVFCFSDVFSVADCLCSSRWVLYTVGIYSMWERNPSFGSRSWTPCWTGMSGSLWWIFKAWSGFKKRSWLGITGRFRGWRLFFA